MSIFFSKYAKVLMLIYENEGLRPTDYVKFIQIGSNTFYQAKDELLAKGLIGETEVHMGRKKEKHLYLTKKGKQIAEALKNVKEITEGL